MRTIIFFLTFQTLLKTANRLFERDLYLSVKNLTVAANRGLIPRQEGCMMCGKNYSYSTESDNILVFRYVSQHQWLLLPGAYAGGSNAPSLDPKKKNIVSWEPEGRYCRSKMFRWEPEGRYCHWLCTAIAPFLFSTDDILMVVKIYQAHILST